MQGWFDADAVPRGVFDETANSVSTFDADLVATVTASSSQPFRSVALAMVVVLSAYAAAEATPSRPTRERVTIAPLTLAYGSQPPCLGDAVPEFYKTVTQAWPLDLEPRLQSPNNQQNKIAPLTLPSGEQPQPQPALTAAELQTIRAWPQEEWGTQHTNVAPVTLTYGSQPVPQGPLSAQEWLAIASWPRDDWSVQRAPISTAWLPLPSWSPFVAPPYSTILANWPADLEPRPHQRNIAPVRVVPLTLAMGDPPVPQGPLSPQELQSIRSWPQEDWTAQSAPKSLAWVVPPGVVIKPPFPYGLILASWPGDLEPRLTRPNERQQTIATLTLSTGDAPAAHAPFSVPTLTAITAALPAWDAQSAPKSAAWNVAIVTQVPYATQPISIRAAWDTAFTTLPRLTPIAALRLTLVDQPSRGCPVAPAILNTLIASWPLDLQPAPPSQILTRPQTAPLTLVYGTLPPNIGTARATRYATVLGHWPADLEPRPARSLGVRPQTVALSLIYGAQPPRRAPLPVAQWPIILRWQPGPNDAQRIAPSAIVCLQQDKVLVHVPASYAPRLALVATAAAQLAVLGSYVPVLGTGVHSDWVEIDFIQIDPEWTS